MSRKVLLILLIVVDVALVVLLLSPIFVHSSSFDKAFGAYLTNPSIENKSLLEAERAKIRMQQLIITGSVFFIFVVNTSAIIVLLKGGANKSN